MGLDDGHHPRRSSGQSSNLGAKRPRPDDSNTESESDEEPELPKKITGKANASQPERSSSSELSSPPSIDGSRISRGYVVSFTQ